MRYMTEISQLYSDMFLEDVQSSINQAKTILTNNGIEHANVISKQFEDIYNTVEVSPENKQYNYDVNIPAFAYLFLGGKDIDQIKLEYSNYLKLDIAKENYLTNKITELINIIKSKKLFKPSEEKTAIIHNYVTKIISDLHKEYADYIKITTDTSKKFEYTENADDIVYNKKDSPIIIYLADSKMKCIHHGEGTGLCISYTNELNYYWAYRMGNYRSDGQGMSTYFVYWKDGSNKILVDALEEGGFSWNPISSNQDTEISKEALINMFPELEKPFEEDVFQFIPYGENERRMLHIDKYVRSILDPELKTLEDLEMFIESDKLVEDEDWEQLPRQWVKQLFKKYIGLGKVVSKKLQHKYLNTQDIRWYETKIIPRNAETSYEYATYVLNGHNVPDIILKSISSSPYRSYQYATDVLKGHNVPDIILKCISSSPHKSYHYATEVLKGQNVPEEMLKSISYSPYHSYDYATEVLKGQNVPDIILKSISTDPQHSYKYARYALEGQNIPEEMLKSISSSPEYSYKYAADVLKGHNVPDIILKSISSSPEYSYEYQQFKKTRINTFDELYQKVLHFRKVIEEKTYINDITPINIRQLSSDMEIIDRNNFTYEYSQDKEDIEDDTTQRGFMGVGLFDDTDNKIKGYLYGYAISNDEYEDIVDIDFDEVMIYDDKLKTTLTPQTFTRIFNPNNTLYTSNFAVDKPYRMGVALMLNNFIKIAKSKGIKYLAFDGLSDTKRLFMTNNEIKQDRLTKYGVKLVLKYDTPDSLLAIMELK